MVKEWFPRPTYEQVCEMRTNPQAQSWLPKASKTSRSSGTLQAAATVREKKAYPFIIQHAAQPTRSKGFARTLLQLLFGETHDGRHIDVNAPGGYEWWYFDALSDDKRYALVAIFFIGSPMSPYYKQCATGENPPAQDWCGVFYALHERPPGSTKWRERAYAYNLYRGGQWSDVNAAPRVQIGGSQFNTSRENDATHWRIELREPKLWSGEVGANFVFSQIPTAFPTVSAPASNADADHAWVCAAPLCDVSGTVSLSAQETISFVGGGYHDHNFGRLPLRDTDIWYWGRAPLVCDDHKLRQAVFYHTVRRLSDEEFPQSETTWLTFEADGAEAPLLRENLPLLTGPTGNNYGMKHFDRAQFAHNVLGDNEQWRVAFRPERGVFSEGPFYRRLPITITAQQKTVGHTAWSGVGEGIGEVFRPARLLGPIASRAVWSRLRRR